MNLISKKYHMVSCMYLKHTLVLQKREVFFFLLFFICKMGIHIKSVKEDIGIERIFLVFRQIELIEENGHMRFAIVFEIFDHLELANE